MMYNEEPRLYSISAFNKERLSCIFWLTRQKVCITVKAQGVKNSKRRREMTEVRAGS